MNERRSASDFQPVPIAIAENVFYCGKVLGSCKLRSTPRSLLIKSSLFQQPIICNIKAARYGGGILVIHCTDFIKEFQSEYNNLKEKCQNFPLYVDIFWVGMIASGFSSRLFERWAHDPRNLLILPGYCVNGTIGWLLLNGERKVRHRGQEIQVKMQVENLSYSAHSDARGIMELVQQSGALNVVLVHGSKANMDGLKKTITKELRIPCYTPPTGVAVNINADKRITTSVSKEYLDTYSNKYNDYLTEMFKNEISLKLQCPKNLNMATVGVMVHKQAGSESSYAVYSEEEFELSIKV